MCRLGNEHRHVFGNAKIRQCKRFVLAQHQIVRLEVTVHDTHGVNRRQPGGNLAQIFDRRFGRNSSSQARAQIAVRKILHGNISMPRRKVLAKNPRHVRVVDLRQQGELLHETLQAVGRVGAVQAHYFQYLRFFGAVWLRQEYRRHAALADLAQNTMAFNRKMGSRLAGCLMRRQCRILWPLGQLLIQRYRVAQCVEHLGRRTRTLARQQSGDFRDIDKFAAGQADRANPARLDSVGCRAQRRP